MIKTLGEQYAAGGLAISAGYAGHGHGPRRLTVKTTGNYPGLLSDISDFDQRHIITYPGIDILRQA